MKTELSELQRVVYEAVAKHGGDDVPLYEMYHAWFPADSTTPREKQQRLGSTVARINAKIAPDALVPGATKQTYRLKKAG